MRKSILIIGVLLITAFSCSSLISNENSIIGTWTVVLADEKLKGVVEIDSLSFYYYFEGIGYLEGKNYYTKKDSLFLYQISNNDTIIESRFLLENVDNANMKMISTHGYDYYEQISEDQMAKYIKDQESRFIDIETIEIKEKTEGTKRE